jgi:hypothetical protein
MTAWSETPSVGEFHSCHARQEPVHESQNDCRSDHAGVVRRRQRSDIDNVDEIQISIPDAVGPGQALSNIWPDIWFNHQITCVELDRLRIIYADGAQQVFRKEEIDRMLAPGEGE